MKHTPTPYHRSASASNWNRGHCFSITRSSGEIVGYVNTEEDSAFIVRACNAHDELVAALELALDYFEQGGVPSEQDERDIRTALRKARGEA